MKIMIRKELISASLLLSFLCLCVCLCPHRGMRGPAALCGPTLFFMWCRGWSEGGMAGKGRMRGRRGDTEGGKKLEEARNRRIRGLGIGWEGGWVRGLKG